MNMSLVDPTILYETSLLLQIEEVFIEKDWFVTKLIKDTYGFTSSEPLELIFSGGTALSKAHNVIKRFSEDVDFRIHSPLPYKRTMLSRWRKAMICHLRDQGWQISDENIRARDEGRYVGIQIDYPTHYPQHRSLRPRLKLEFRARQVQLTASMCQLSSFVNTVAKQLPEIPAIACLNIIENAADKIAALAWRVPARKNQVKRADDPNMVRHLHDLAKLLPVITDQASLLRCLKTSMQTDAEETHQDLTEQDFIAQMQTAIAILKASPRYKEEYAVFVEGMVYENRASWPSFEEGVTAIESLIQLWE
jgi:predicted nucleotidyltransferase component of viral defense system